MMNSPIDPIIVEARKRLQEVEQILNHKRRQNGLRGSYFGKEDLICERIQLRLLLGELHERKPMGTPGHPTRNEHLTKDGKMIIEFETNPTQLVFQQVRDGEMFVGSNGSLYQKSSESEGEAWEICNSSGEPTGVQECFSECEQIAKIMPKIRRIAF
jgi:hypothetical protein